MKLDTVAKIKTYLATTGLADKADNPMVQNLSGGVSSSVWKIVLGNNRWVMKQALGKLNVEEDWFSDVERIHREHQAMGALNNFLPIGAIPKVLHVDYINHIYMMTCAEEDAQTWKDILMKGTFRVPVAENAAYLLRKIHHLSRHMDAENKAKFQDQKYFIQLRVDPFHRFLMEKYPELSPFIQELVNDVTVQKTCLVHGDFSPKNILVGKCDSIELIDFEVAHWGNPVFDLAYCIGHLMLKGWYLKEPHESVKLIEAFITAYGSEVSDIIPHLGLMLLARVDGKSPVDYIKEESLKNVIRKVAISWIQHQSGDAGTMKNVQEAFSIDP